MTTKQVVFSIGGTAVLIAPGAEVEYAVIAPHCPEHLDGAGVCRLSDGTRPKSCRVCQRGKAPVGETER